MGKDYFSVRLTDMADTNTIHSLTSTLATIADPSQNLSSSNHVTHVPPQPQPPPPPQQHLPPPVSVAPLDPNAPPNGNPDSPAKRRPGRPKGSVKKPVDPNAEPKVKRPVGRPRKDGLPAGSVGPKRPSTRPRKRPPGTFASGAQSPSMYPYSVSSRSSTSLHGSWFMQATPFGDQWPGSISAPPMGTLPGRPPAQIPFPIDPSLDRDNWAELLRIRPDIFLHTLVSSLSAPNPLSVGGLSVEEAFKAHLASLATTNKNAMTPMIPTLYSLLKTFWLPMSPVYFSLTASASTSRTPSEHRFLYWDPHPLVFNGIACPACASPLVNKGRIVSGPLKIYDLGKPFFVIGCEYVCASPVCCPPNTQGEGRRFASTDASILRALPPKLRDEFPARLLEGAGATPDLGTGPEVWSWRGMGVSVALWNMARASLRAGLRKDAILGIIRGIIDGVPDEVPWAFPLAAPVPSEPKNGIESGQKDGEDGGDGDIGGEEEEEEEEEVNGDLVGDKDVRLSLQYPFITLTR